ncbi:hypothetical protein HanPSC8_Chr17g0777341 [Helianthus annuus]|nr:hypothetical protein HanPSC8_Chr17g0777341 [Helianthus annuus]
MASGSSKGFDFASDDILCSYEDYANQEQSNGSHSDPAIATNSNKEFNKSRMARTSVFPNSSYSPPDDSGNQEVIIMAVERSMKKHTDNVMRFLEGLSSRLSQLELYCYNLDKSIGEMRSDLTRDHGESEAKLKFLEKHVQEVHRSVQILRDKQELADTQKELAKLQLAQKESSSSSSQQNEEGSSTPDGRKKESSPDSHGQQLALVPAPQPQRTPEPVAQPQPQAYYLPPAPLQAPAQVNQTQYPQSQLPPTQPQQPPPSQIHQVPQYQQQWTPQPQVQPQPGMQPATRPTSPQVYPQYLMTQPPVNPSPEPAPNSMPMQMPYSAIPPPGSNQPVSYSYGGPVRAPQPQPQPQPPPQQQPPQHLKPGYGGPPGDGYTSGGGPNAYMMYDNEPGRVQHHNQGGQFYPPNQPHQSGGGGGSGGGMMARPAQQFMHNHPYNELIDKLVSMGYRGDHVMSVIQRLDESGQTVDFNAVLDKLNGHPSQRGWSG